MNRMPTAYHAQVQRLLDGERDPHKDLDPDLVGALVRLGCVRLVVTPKGLSTIADDGMVSVKGVLHVQDCERVRLAARGSRRRGDCTCGSDPS